jgi:hypothetical protein
MKINSGDKKSKTTMMLRSFPYIRTSSWYCYKSCFVLQHELKNFTFYKIVQGGSNMTGTDLCVNKPHCAAAVRLWEGEATTSTLPPVQSCLGVARVFGNYGLKKKSVPVIFEPPCILSFNFDVFYMFRNRGFIFRETVVYTVMVHCVLHASV